MCIYTSTIGNLSNWFWSRAKKEPEKQKAGEAELAKERRRAGRVGRGKEPSSDQRRKSDKCTKRRISNLRLSNPKPISASERIRQNILYCQGVGGIFVLVYTRVAEGTEGLATCRQVKRRRTPILIQTRSLSYDYPEKHLNSDVRGLPFQGQGPCGGNEARGKSLIVVR